MEKTYFQQEHIPGAGECLSTSSGFVNTNLLLI